ncbi:hypothetical protein CesoFtcFv8_015509 [Champsocephalus esox]|uniref:Uncharacterized protein n=1 Tax=Champsocephalus esox TaxID=159716 RepID=A0AAN8BQF2_9TELE|nr:hypothetical protein CesoFtcFv8_015509 [Champsocephalus esox]
MLWIWRITTSYHPHSCFHKPSFLFALEWLRQDVDSRWRRKGGLDPRLGYSGKEGGHVPVCFALWDGSRGGDLYRVRWGRSLLSSHSQLLGLGRKEVSHDVHSSSMLDLELNGDNEVDRVE